MDEIIRFTDLEKSTNYKDRFVGEYQMLKMRYTKLSDMLTQYKNNELAFVPQCPIELLEKQSEVMHDYLLLLEERAKIEDIDISLLT